MNASPVVGLIEEVVVTGTESSTVVLAKCDTGAKRTPLDSDVAHVLGLDGEGSDVTVRSSNGVGHRAVYPFRIELRGRTHDVRSSVTDRSAMRYDAILGRDVLSSYLVVPRRFLTEVGGTRDDRRLTSSQTEVVSVLLAFI